MGSENSQQPPTRPPPQMGIQRSHGSAVVGGCAEGGNAAGGSRGTSGETERAFRNGNAQHPSSSYQTPNYDHFAA
ncbi:unnamed protein product, partial [Amoebophrya sp. A25]|eukprot:GSA25T00021523001.1